MTTAISETLREAVERQKEHGGTAPGKQSRQVSSSEGRAPQTRDKIAAVVGTSGRIAALEQEVAALRGQIEREQFARLLVADELAELRAAIEAMKPRERPGKPAGWLSVAQAAHEAGYSLAQGYKLIEAKAWVAREADGRLWVDPSSLTRKRSP